MYNLKTQWLPLIILGNKHRIRVKPCECFGGIQSLPVG